MRACILTAALLAAALSAGSGQAQTLLSNDGPAEYPPASYSANQYVDSRGCVYIRAGYAGQVQWIPRVTRERKLVCGYQPTFAAQPAAKPSAPVPAPAPRVAAAPTPEPAPKVDARPSSPAGATTATTATPKGAALQAAEAAGACGGAEVLSARYVKDGSALAVRCGAETEPAKVAATPAPRPAPAAQTALAAVPSSACPGASPLSARYINDGKGLAVRCGPQQDSAFAHTAGAAPYVALAATAPVPRTSVKRPVRSVASSAPLSLTVTPRTAARPATPSFKIPEGYQAAWKDGRLNPNRAKGTPQGEAQMDLVWTRTVPRRLIDKRTGKDVTADLSYLNYPYTDPAAQQRAVARASTKSAPARVTASASDAQHRYVQVGSFGEPQNAKATAVKLKRLGLPVRLAKSSAQGKPLQIVLAGPFDTQNTLNSALGTVRKAGYRDAFLRR